MTIYEPVDPADLKTGDKVRLVADDGTLVWGTANDDRTVTLAIGSVFWKAPDGYRFEREQTPLPTGFGLFASAREIKAAGDDQTHFDVWLHDTEGGWTNLYIGHDPVTDESEVPTDLVPLVPSTEADELRARIDLIRLAVQTGRLALAGNGNRDLLMQMLDGGTK